MRGVEDLHRWLERRAEKRRYGRLRIESTLKCTAGRVLDLSMGGLRILARRAPREKLMPIRIWDAQSGIQTEANVVWHIRRGFMRHELGLQLPPLDDEDRAFLIRVAERHRWRQSLRDFDLGTRDVA